MTTIRVHVDYPTHTVPVGTARIMRSRGVDTTEFTYDPGFLAGPAWEISPDLPIATRAPVIEGLPGALDDSAPDAWGRNLITRRLAAEARDAGHPAPTATDLDYLLGVNDGTRQGALRFCRDDGLPFLSESTEVPQLLELEALLDAARQVVDDRDADEAVAALLAAGSGSLGGARPKASVADGDVLHIAKFPHTDDGWDVMRWEAVALDLAAACGLRTPTHRLVTIGDSPVLLVERFDRSGQHRVPYLSARSLIGAATGSGSDYLELVEGITQHGSAVTADLIELWRRIAFSVTINNTDDHLRNHAFLRGPGGWSLSPIFDVNPNPNPAMPRLTSIAGATTSDACRDALFASAAHFGLDQEAAETNWDDIVSVVTHWRSAASRNGIPDDAHPQFAPALDRWSS